MELIIRIVMLLSSAASFCYGLFKFFRRKVALFKILISGAVGCFMLGRLYELVTILAAGEISSVFNVGMLATLGGFSFIFSASFSQMDGLVDDRSRELARYRYLAVAAPAVIIVIFIPVAASSLGLCTRLISFILFLFIGAASYMNLKHLIIPDVSFGIISSIRTYSLSSLITAVLYALQLVAEKLGFTALWIAVSLLIALAYPCIILTMERGSGKWTT